MRAPGTAASPPDTVAATPAMQTAVVASAPATATPDTAADRPPAAPPPTSTATNPPLPVAPNAPSTAAEMPGRIQEISSPQALGDISMPDLRKMVSECRKCELHNTRTHTVFGDGQAPAEWMFVGEAPGQNEDLQGEPFVGRAGKLLNLMLAALGLDRERVFIANMLKCRPPANRDPKPEEIAQCEPYLQRQLALVRPKVIVALGRISAQAMLKTEQPLAKLRGQIHRYGADETPLIVTYHPAYLLRSPEQKSKSWEDLWRAKQLVA